MKKMAQRTTNLFLPLTLLGLLGGCQTSMDSYFKGLLDPDGAAAEKSTRAAAQIQPHESWCYKTLGRVDCYTTPQSAEAERLIGVDPPAVMPTTKEGHADAALARAKARK